MRTALIVVALAALGALGGCANCPGPNCALGRALTTYGELSAQQQRVQTCVTTCSEVDGYLTCQTTCP